MFPLRCLCFLTLASALSAQGWEYGMTVGRQTFGSLSASDGMPGYAPSGSVAGTTVVSARLAWTILDTDGGELQVACAFQPTTTATARFSVQPTTAPGLPRIDSGPLNYRCGYHALGVSYRTPGRVRAGVGLDLRFQRVDLPASAANAAETATTAVPWIRGGLYLPARAGWIRPIVGVEAGLALLTTSDAAHPAGSLRPRSEVALYAGARF
ncbi:hypothetical protein [Mesoterricola sediminis]|uniref:Outer membrane protein beta-barrel domain-containing protein n=1 Tax=Mesoterricola sediminis TaxID=2927980 RepID=A0AA48H4U4_9BACT|nr:hypothetical protein [Mesoterricola sediminis]BDU77461.1 hypothetical protein METESE_24190 [Mesoterricola sediminis]